MSSPVSPSQRTVIQIVEHWRQKNKKNDRSFTDRNYKATLFSDDLGSRIAEELTLQDVLDWFASNPSKRHAARKGAVKRKRTWDEGTVTGVKRVISRVFNLAVEDKLIGFHRLQSLGWQSEPRTKKRRLLTDEEYQLMRKHATDDLFCRYIELIRETDSRPGEAAKLKWEDINWEDGTAVLQEKKTDRPRLIPLGKCIDMLRRLRTDAGNPHKGHIFVNQNGLPWSAQTLAKRMHTLRKRSGLGKDVHFDGLRRPRLVNADLVEVKGKIGDREVETIVSIPKDDVEGDKPRRRGETPHTEIQYRLLDAGSQMKLAVWAPPRDRGRDWKGKVIGDIPGMRTALPTEFDKQTNRIIQEIDVIWIEPKRERIVAAFEVEQSTSMYSGLLRISDLLSMCPNLGSEIKLYITAPDDRIAEFRSQVARPTFNLLHSPNPLHRLRRFLPYSKLCTQLTHALNLNFCVTPDFIDSAAELYEPGS